MATSPVMKTLNAMHKALLALSGNKVGWTAGKMPVVELTTTGRKSGEKRTVMLTSPLVIDGSIILIASNNGGETHPAWFHNLSANPSVSVRYKGQPQEQRTARIASQDEKAEIWPQALKVYPSYANKQKKTSRDIPVVFLDKPSS